MNYIITNDKDYFKNIGKFNYCNLEDMVLTDTIAVDTETTGLECAYNNGQFIGADIFAIQIGTGKDNYLIDLQTHTDGYKVKQVIPYLKGRTQVYHNSTFDLKHFYKEGYFPEKVQDTMIMSKMLYNGGKNMVYTHNFGSVMSRELDIHYDKSEQKNIAHIQLSTQRAIEYCFNDVDKLVKLSRVLYRKLIKDDMVEAYTVNANFTKGLAYMEMCGLPISEEKWVDKVSKDRVKQCDFREKIVEYIYDGLPKYQDLQGDLFDNSKKVILNLDSPKQMVNVFKDLGINVRNSKGKDSIKEDVINKTKHEFVDMWLDYQGVTKNLSTFGMNVLDKSINGRIYTSFNPIVDTNRIAARKGGINFLNFPADKITRSCFVARKGYKMVVCDYDGQENVVGADLHHDAMMVASINEGKDLHCAFARLLFPEKIADKTDSEIKKYYPELRQYAKAPRFAFAYGGNGFTISKDLNISIKKGEEIEDLFKDLHKGVYVWGDKKYKESAKNGYITSQGGFRLYLPNYEMFSALEGWIETLDKHFWGKYREGKIQYKKLLENKKRVEDGEDEYEIENEYTYELYLDNKGDVSRFFRLKSRYYRLCLNNPVQAGSALQTKAAIYALFKQIIDNGDQWKVFICNSPYDEIVLETFNKLTKKYQKILEDTMVNEGNKKLKSGLVEMSAKACVGATWNDAKG